MEADRWEREASMIRRTRAYRLAVYNIAFLTWTVLIGIPIFILGFVNIISRSWFWVIIGVGTVEALIGCLAVISMLILVQRKKLGTLTTMNPQYIAATMNQSMRDVRSVMKSGRLTPG